MSAKPTCTPVEELSISDVTKEAKKLQKRLASLGTDLPLSKLQKVVVMGHGWSTYHAFEKARKAFEQERDNDCEPLIVKGRCCPVCGSQRFVGSITLFGDALYDETDNWIEDLEMHDSSFGDQLTCLRCDADGSGDMFYPAEFDMEKIRAYSGRKGTEHIELRENSGLIFTCFEYGGHVQAHPLKEGIEKALDTGKDPVFVLASYDGEAKKLYTAARKQAEKDPHSHTQNEKFKRLVERGAAELSVHFHDEDTNCDLTLDMTDWARKQSIEYLRKILNNQGRLLDHAEVEDIAEINQELADMLTARRVILRNRPAPAGYSFDFDMEELANWIKVYDSLDSGQECSKCGTSIENGYCKDATCPYSDWPQHIPLEMLYSLSTEEIEGKYKVKKRQCEEE